MPRHLLWMMLFLTIAATALPGGSATYAAPGYEIQVVKTGLDRPWSINFAPDGRLFFTARNSGRLYALNTATGNVQTFSGLPPARFRAEQEAGMMGMALDPDFATNGWAYICYSFFDNDGNRRNRLSRFTVNPVSGAVSGERVLIETMVGALYHNGCRVIVSPDNRYLFVSMGDATVPSLAQDLDSTGGKTFRIFKDGSIPTDNPFYDNGRIPRSLIWTYGHRNHQGLAFHPTTGDLWSTEHGPEIMDELNVLIAGRNYGWGWGSGPHYCLGTVNCGSVPDFMPPVAVFNPERTVATSDMVFYTGSAFPEWSGDLFFVTLKTGRLYRLKIDNRTIVEQEILIDGTYGRLRDVTVGPDGFLYISTDETSAQLLRIRPTIERPYRVQLPLVMRG
ncbi:PQQ-dependent sugar dehydrogenase [Roseiflexus castenholzii]|uniref:Glucose sorbosone dehydrogenase n=1 Tax=Roseiflexus castenholzii (strain DSM 13941 / HLO8) TaxID=383372 RepID=A7NFR8_ROSCS|nr:PQQ-dependent sugar dehydrogenase [Roseiflexus castenholzii]ABU56297.1 glucose sorbosone dehydrogenase [Roseiflexus castenholzii DSM 13941]